MRPYNESIEFNESGLNNIGKNFFDKMISGTVGAVDACFGCTADDCDGCPYEGM